MFVKLVTAKNIERRLRDRSHKINTTLTYSYKYYKIIV